MPHRTSPHMYMPSAHYILRMQFARALRATRNGPAKSAGAHACNSDACPCFKTSNALSVHEVEGAVGNHYRPVLCLCCDPVYTVDTEIKQDLLRLK